MSYEQPQQAIDDFAARFGPQARAYLDLAQHAALPLALTPDLLYLIWFNFRSDEQERPLHIPWVAVADLLLSHLCREISHETYAIDDGVRHLLWRQMMADPRFGPARVRRLALFLDQYAGRQLHSDNPYTQEAGEAQRLAAYAYANPQQLVDYLAQRYQRPLPRPQMIRYATLMETLQAPVSAGERAGAPTQQTFAQAQAVGRSLAEYARGDVETAVAQLRERFGAEVTIGGAPVALPDEVQQALGFSATSTGLKAVTLRFQVEGDIVHYNVYDERFQIVNDWKGVFFQYRNQQQEIVQNLQQLVDESDISEEPIKILGERIFNILVDPATSRRFFDLYSAQLQDSNRIVRLEILITNSTSSEVKHMPWEMAFVPANSSGKSLWLGVDLNMALSRYYLFPDERQVETISVREKIEAFFVTASPDDLEPISTESIVDSIEKYAKAAQGLWITGSEGTTSNLTKIFSLLNVDILIFTGHSRAEQNNRELVYKFALVSGNPDETYASWYTAKEFAGQFFQEQPPPLLILNLEHSLQIASDMVEAGVSAAIATQFRMREETFSLFLQTLFEQLVREVPLDYAVQLSRAALVRQLPQYPRDSVAPVLITTLRGSALFNIVLKAESEQSSVAEQIEFFNDYVDRTMFDVSARLEAALRAVGAWQQDPGRAPVMLITGQPGSGKTNLAANFVKQARQGSTMFGLTPQMVGAYHFCMADRPQTLDARLFVRSVQQQLAARFPRFREALPDDSADDPAMPWEAWVRQQLIWPLESLTGATLKASQQTAQPPQENVLIVVDDVDAATQHNDAERIVDVCLRLVDELPHVRLLLTTVMSTAVRDALAARDTTYFTLDTVYRNFDLRIGAAPNNQRAREVMVLASPAGASPTPFMITHDDDLVRRVNGELSRVSPETPRQPIGADLFRTFIAEETRRLFEASLAQVRQVGERLRLRLFLEGPDYVSLPWEWLFADPPGYWAQQPDVSLVRHREQTAVFRTRANPQPINVLFASAMPKSGPPFPAQEMAEALRRNGSGLSGRVQFSTVQNASWQRLRSAVGEAAVHVLHLAVAVEHEYGRSMLVMENEGRPALLDVKEMAAAMQENALALVVLSAVRADQWTAVLRAADELVAAGLPAVVAFPAEMHFDVMAQSVTSLLDQLADGAWLDTAAAAAREAMAALREGEAAGVDLALFTSTPHGNIWRSEITAVDLYEGLAEGFTLAELQDLCFELQVDYEQLEGEGRRGKMVSLVREMQDRLQALALAILDARPNTNFVYRRQETVDETAVPPSLLDETTLSRVLNENFNLEELRIICLELDVDFEALREGTRSGKAQDLVVVLARQQRLAQLAVIVLRERPHLQQQFQAGGNAPTADPVEVFRILAERFSFDELHDLIFELGVDAEDLPGEKKEAKARELVLWMQRHGRLPELVQAIQRVRGLPTASGETGAIDVDYDEGIVSIGDVDLPIEGEAPAAPPMPPQESEASKGVGSRPPAGEERPSPQALRRALVENFDMDELRTVAFELRIDYENLAGQDQSTKALDLVQQAQREGRLQDLEQLIRRQRPYVDLGGPPEAT